MKPDGFAPHLLRFFLEPSTTTFYHNVNRDLNFFILWEKARHAEAGIAQLIKERFSLLYAAEIEWSPQHVARNFSRLYDRPGIEKAQKANNVGDGPFALYIICDDSPQHRYDRSVSGDIELVNTRVAATKAEIRGMLGGKFLIHSSNNIREFFEQTVLLLGPKQLKEVLNIVAWDGKVHSLKQDLAGAAGWKSFTELFAVLNVSSNYLVMRNFEELPDEFFESGEKDLDILCDRLFRFAAAANATRRGRPDKHSAYAIHVAEKDIPIDARYVGDGYYDELWQSTMLARKEQHKDLVYIPRTDDHFFSLLYHAKIQKFHVKDKYLPRLSGLARQIGLGWVNDEWILNDEKAADLLLGYLRSNGYRYVEPKDQGVIRNKAVLQHIVNADMQLKSHGDIKERRQQIPKRARGEKQHQRNFLKRFSALFTER